MTWSNDVTTRLIALLPIDGTPRPNAELKLRLNLPDAEYWRARNQLLEEGRVTKSPGRGGRTALAVTEDDVANSDASKIRTWMLATVFSLAVATLVAAVVYGVALWGSERLAWDVLALAFGGVTVAAVGVSMLIYKVQTDANRLEAEGQARILKRLEALARQAATSSADARDLLQAMRPAVEADGSTDALPASVEFALEPSDEPEKPAEDAIIRAQHGTYYRPPAIPLKVLRDLVNWWDSRGETGRWTVSRLIGGYRSFNASGTFTGVPWVITFDNGDESVRSFRISYSGNRSGPSINELAKEGVWLDFREGDR